MFNFLFNNKGEEEMARIKTSKTSTILRNLFNTVVDVAWKTLKTNLTYNLQELWLKIKKRRYDDLRKQII